MTKKLPQSGKIFVTLDAIQGKEIRKHSFGVNFAFFQAKFMTKPDVKGLVEIRLVLRIFQKLQH